VGIAHLAILSYHVKVKFSGKILPIALQLHNLLKLLMAKNPNFKANSNTSPQSPTWKYETAVAEIESIISRIETGELELEEVFEQFTQAVEYLQQCEHFLQQRQQQVNLLIETLNNEM
jgi:exodeoxyribonuclease VII small subunit